MNDATGIIIGLAFLVVIIPGWALLIYELFKGNSHVSDREENED